MSHDWWAFVLEPHHPIPRSGELLAVHPDASTWAQWLVRGLTIERLVLIANKEVNTISRYAEARLAAPDRVRAAESAWNELKRAIQKRSTQQHTFWTGAVKLLDNEHVADALEQIRGLDIARLMLVCHRVRSGPYEHARQHQIR